MGKTDWFHIREGVHQGYICHPAYLTSMQSTSWETLGWNQAAGRNIKYREISMQVKKQQLELDMEQQTGSKYGKEYVKAVYCHPAHLTYMQTTSCEMLGWMKHKLESRWLPGEISVTSDMQITPPLWQKAKN